MRAVWKFALVTAVIGATLAAAPRRADSPARELYQSLNNLRVDPSRVYTVREIALRRDAVRISLSEGKLAFLTPLDGKVIGAVFIGRGRVLAVPRDAVEKFSIARFLGTPLLDEPFSKAYLRFTDGTAAELERQLRESAAPTSPDGDFADGWNATVANLNPWHSLRALCDWLSTSPVPYFYGMVLGDHTGPLDVMVDDRREEQVVLGRARSSAGGHFYDLWASFPRAEAAAENARIVAPVAYTVDTTITADLGLEGHATLLLKALRGGERVIPLELSRALTLESLAADDGQPLPFFQNEELSRKEIAERGNDSFLVVLPAATRVGQELRLRASYRGSVISDAGNGVYFVGDRGTWYPHAAGLGSFVNFDLHFRWPRRLTLVATGKKTQEQEDGDWRSGRWQSEMPVVLAGFNLGEYASEQLDAGGVRIAVHANRQLERAILDRFNAQAADPMTDNLMGRGRPTPPPGVGDLPPSVMPPPNPAAVLKQLAHNVAESTKEMERWNGPFPFHQLEISPIPGSFGQGWPGLLYLSTMAFLPPEAERRAGVARREQLNLHDLMPYHEVAHQWWGNVVAWTNYRDAWIGESLANYCALLYLEGKKPAEHTLGQWLENYRDDLIRKLPEGEGIYDDAGPLVLGQRLESSVIPDGYARVVYPKGTWVIHMLRMMLRDAGSKEPDARFNMLLRGLVEEHRGAGLSTAEFQRAVERVMTREMALEGGHSMDWFFDEWVRGTGIPRYQLEFKISPQAQSYMVRGTLKQSGVPEHFLARVPLYAAGSSGKLVLLGAIVTDAEATPFQFATRMNPKRVVIGPNQTMLWRAQ
jgi:hypothetical protein